MFKLGELGRYVLLFIYFKEVESHFWFLAYGGGRERWLRDTQALFKFVEDSLLHRWSQVNEILTTVNNYQMSNSDHLTKVMYELNQITSKVQEYP